MLCGDTKACLTAIAQLVGISFALCLMCKSEGAEFPQSYPSNEQLRQYRSVSNPRVSPDGTQVLVQITESTAEGGKPHLWLVAVGDADSRQLTFSRDSDVKGEDSGEWMPDGKDILFLAHRGEHTELYMLPMNGGEARSLQVKLRPIVDDSKQADALPPPIVPDKNATGESGAEEEVDISAYAVSGDGKSIALVVKDPETPGERRQHESKADAQWVDHDEHGTRVYLMDLATKKITQVPISINVKEAVWNHGSSQFVVVSEKPNDAGDLGPARDSWLVKLSDLAHPEHIIDLPSTTEGVSWSTDDRSLLFRAQAMRDAPPDFHDLYMYDVAAKVTRNLTDGLDGSIDDFSVDEMPSAISMPDGSCVTLIVGGVEARVAQIAPGAIKPMLLTLPMTAVTRVATNAAQTGWVFLGSSGGRPPELYFATDLTATPKKLSIPSLLPEHVRTTAPTRISWKNEGLTIQGLLYLPPEAERGRVPLIVQVHGGPTGLYVDQFDPFVDFLLGHGWAVLKTNPRGSLGRGAAFAAANKNDLGGADYRDIMKGVDYVSKSAPIDHLRMALIGYSYGGEMAGFVEGKTQRFKAIVSGAPVIDQYSEYGTEDESWYDRWFFGKPWERWSDAWRQSPLSGVAHARTPFLLLQGQNDTVDPMGQSQEMYRALRQMNVPVDLITYPRVNHVPLESAIFGNPSDEPWHGFDARRRIVAFIEKSFAAGK